MYNCRKLINLENTLKSHKKLFFSIFTKIFEKFSSDAKIQNRIFYIIEPCYVVLKSTTPTVTVNLEVIVEFLLFVITKFYLGKSSLKFYVFIELYNRKVFQVILNFHNYSHPRALLQNYLPVNRNC